MSKIEKERFVVRDRAFDHGDGFVGDDIGEIEIVRYRLDPAVVFKLVMG